MSPIRSTFVSTTAVIVAAFAVVAMMSTTSRQVEAFAPLPTPRWTVGGVNQQIVNVRTLNMGFFSDEERKALTRDSEPEDYFQTNTDKMSDEEKFPIAIMGLVGISAPFILGLIALYAARY